VQSEPDSQRFAVGDAVVVRYITRIDGLPGMTWPYRVVHDEDDLVALWLPRGSKGMLWRMVPGQPRELVEGDWRRDTLRLMFPGKPYSIWLFWEGEPRVFTTYYVNFEEPFRRTAVGFDTNDHALDIMVAPDLTWRWKDRDEFEGLIAAGHFSPELGEAVEETAREVLALVDAGSAPFDASWCDWTCPDDWEIPALHPRWRDEPQVQWERREWAYPLAVRRKQGDA
jgi:predicted RNA-binding protein associated with RNAse of E/G family